MDTNSGEYIDIEDSNGMRQRFHPKEIQFRMGQWRDSEVDCDFDLILVSNKWYHLSMDLVERYRPDSPEQYWTASEIEQDTANKILTKRLRGVEMLDDVAANILCLIEAKLLPKDGPLAETAKTVHGRFMAREAATEASVQSEPHTLPKAEVFEPNAHEKTGSISGANNQSTIVVIDTASIGKNEKEIFDFLMRPCGDSPLDGKNDSSQNQVGSLEVEPTSTCEDQSRQTQVIDKTVNQERTNESEEAEDPLKDTLPPTEPQTATLTRMTRRFFEAFYELSTSAHHALVTAEIAKKAGFTNDGKDYQRQLKGFGFTDGKPSKGVWITKKGWEKAQELFPSINKHNSNVGS